MHSTDCGILFKQIADHIAQRANKALKENHLTLSQLRYLEYLADKKNESVPFKEFEEYFKVRQPTVAGILSRLCQKGLIKTEHVPKSRAKTASLTSKGREELKKAIAYRSATEADLLAPLSVKERKTLKELLQKIITREG